MNCPQCNTIVPESLRNCPACEYPIGFPNVRVAEKVENIEALKKRVNEAEISTSARKCNDILEEFGNAVCFSKVLICRDISTVSRLMKSDNELLNTFYQQIESAQRLPQDNAWDISRASVDSKLFPNYHKEIHFGVLVLSNDLLENYGNCGLLLLDKTIHERTSFFEENAVLFFEKHGIAGRKPVPNGYRAAWKDRNLLAKAKLHAKLDSTTTKDNFSRILFSKSQDGISDNFIEAHVYGKIHRRSVEHVLAKLPRERCDRVLLESLKSLLKKDGISLEIV